MAELSTATTKWLLEWLENHSVTGEEWAEGICEPEALQEPGGMIDWETFAALCDRLAEFSEAPPPSVPLLPSPAKIGREIAEAIFLSSVAPAKSSNISPKRLFVEEAPKVASQLFPGLEVRAEVAADGEITFFEFALPDDAHDCPAFFELIKGAIEAAPLLVNLNAADVACEHQRGGARFVARIPTRIGNGLPMAGRIEAKLDENFGHEFEVDVDHNVDRRNASVSFDQNDNGPTNDDEPSWSLNPSFAASLADLRAPDQVGSHLFEMLRSDFQSNAARVWIDSDFAGVAFPTDDSHPISAQDKQALLKFGESDKPPSHSLQLSAAGQCFGRLDIWDGAPLTNTKLDRLDQIIPWYALTLRSVLAAQPQAEQQDSRTQIADLAKRVEELNNALTESKERFHMLAENPFDLIMEMDDHARITFASTTFDSVLGYTTDALIGIPGHMLVHPQDRQSAIENFAQTVETLGTSQIALRVACAYEGYRNFETTLNAYRSAKGKRVVFLISRDTTDRVESSIALEQTEQKFLQSQKMEAVGRMAGGVAHDFNNLLTAITGYCDLLLEELGPQHPARADAEEILKASERAAGLTHQLLAFSRRQVLQPRVLDPNNLVADMDRMLRRLIGEGIELITILGGGAWPVLADPGQVQQVMLNLVVNARDAMPGGGRISIETENTSLAQPRSTEFGEIPPGEYLTLRVADTGSGMTKDLLQMIFEPFFTTKESGKGTGLGLSMVIGIVQQSGGHIDVESALSRGSTFSIFLPRAENVAMLPERDSGSKQFSGRETVLLVEDSEPVRRLVIRCLKSKGYTVLEASSGIDALRVCSRHEDPIHLLLTDVILPKMDGFEVAKRVVSSRPDTKVIYMSGFTDDALKRHGLESRDVALLEKPFTPSTLLRTVREFLDDGTHPVTPIRIDPSDHSGA
jgi:PAS domain S-box-containing protein